MYGTHDDVDQMWYLSEETPQVDYEYDIDDPFRGEREEWSSYVVLPQSQ